MFNKRYVDVKAPGPDTFNCILHEATSQVAGPLSQSYNYSLHCCKMPSAWKLSNVRLIFKGGDPSIPSNYRPVSLLHTMEKVLERIIFKHVFNHLKDTNFFTPHQSGLLPGVSTVNQLTYIYEKTPQGSR